MPLRLFDEDNFTIVQLIHDKIKSDPTDKLYTRMDIFCQLIYPDDNNLSALDIAIENRDIKFINIVFQALVNLPKLKISSFFLKKHLKTLSNLLLHSFDTYLAQCTFKNSLMKELKYTEWKSSGDYVLHGNPF